MPETPHRPSITSYASGNGLFYFAITLGIGVVVATAILSSYKTNLLGQIGKLDGQLQATEDSRNKEHEQVLLAAAKQSALMRTLLTGKLYWSQALGFMEQMTQSAVTFSQISADVQKGSITIVGTADSYATVARQIAAFVNGTGIRDVSVKSVKASPGGVEFIAELTIDTKTLLTKSLTKTP